jgi:type I restriction enzyme R subunit
MQFNENTRVKIPAILHLCRLGYKYISLKNAVIDESTNIFPDIFFPSIRRLNPELNNEDVKKIFEDVSFCLDYEDLGKKFYEMLTNTSGVRLVDFENFSNNDFHVVTELTCKNGDEEFRPDITLLVNGMPLAFIEVKKPNNHDGILAERDRINVRFKNSKFRKFINQTQLIVFSNNMEYDSESIEPIQGAFYATTAKENAIFNCFREEEKLDLATLLMPEDEDVENFVLKDNNLQSIKSSPEFITNKKVDTPTNRVSTSLFSKNRFATLLKYGIAYVQGEKGLEKHIMRYPQFFATMEIRQKLESDVRRGIIWHTQGSGKTALAFYNVHFLTDYYSQKQIVPKFYFIVDRLDLLKQAAKEFSSRGLVVHLVNSKEELLKNFRENQAINNDKGQREITVVNIQKFSEDNDVLRINDYDVSIQRVYFLDEVHRSYNPKGSFLANLVSSDRNSVMIGLTGTPLIGVEGKARRSKDTFGDYIHKYYYNSSIADGYTLKLIREGIETKYRIQLEKALKEIEVLKGDLDKRVIYSHEKFVTPLLEYIIKDFQSSRIRFGDDSIGCMVVCDSSDQAKKMFELFKDNYGNQAEISGAGESLKKAAEDVALYKGSNEKGNLTAGLILHDVSTKDGRNDIVEEFKEGRVDILFVYNMLLTGFDAKRLKKLYLGRLIKSHNLLQTLTRVNRPYKKFRYGYVVDFADIRKEFEATNKAYFKELQEELGDEIQTYSNLFKSREEIEAEIKDFNEKLFHYDLENAEIFSQQISEIQDRAKALEIKKALENARNLFNVIRFFGYDELLDRVDFKKLNQLYNEASRHLDLLNLKENLENSTDTTNLLNVALENVLFLFKKVSEKELIIADKLKETLKKTRESMAANFDKKDPAFVSLYDELKRLFDGRSLEEITQEEMKENIDSLNSIMGKVSELNRKNNLLKAKYENDEKYARIHKRLLEQGLVSSQESRIFTFLKGLKTKVDERILQNTRLLSNEGYFNQMLMKLLIEESEEDEIDMELEDSQVINACIAKEYLNEYQGINTW